MTQLNYCEEIIRQDKRICISDYDIWCRQTHLLVCRTTQVWATLGQSQVTTPDTTKNIPVLIQTIHAP